MDEVDKSHCHWFLCGLGTEFAGLSSTQLSLSSPTPIHDRVLLVESHDLFQKSLESQSLPIVAFIATLSLSGHWNQFRNHHSRGGFYRYFGHSSSRNINSQPKGPRSNWCPYNLKCQICKIKDNMTDICRNRYDHSNPSTWLDESFRVLILYQMVLLWLVSLDMDVSTYMTSDSTILDFSKQHVGKDSAVILWLGSLQLLQKLCTRSFLCSCNLLSLDQSFHPFYNTVIETSDRMLIHCQFAYVDING